MRVLLGVLLDVDDAKVMASVIQTSLGQYHSLSGRQTFTYYGLTLDVGRRQLLVDAQVLHLTNRESDFLGVLISSPEIFFTRRFLIDRVYSPDHHMGERSVAVHFSRIRSKLPQQYRSWLCCQPALGYALINKNTAAP